MKNHSIKIKNPLVLDQPQSENKVSHETVLTIEELIKSSQLDEEEIAKLI